MIIKFLLVFKGDFFYFDVSAGDSMDIPGDFMLLSSKKNPAISLRRLCMAQKTSL